MNYKFPIILTIDDVLPHVKDREEFIVAEREFGTVINYVVSLRDTFDMSGPNDVGGAIRRECRGIMFDHNGVIMSRPFHKFFNVNERLETMAHCIDMSEPHIIMEKMDGSMIRPIFVNGQVRLATKMGLTDVALQAEEWLKTKDSGLMDWLADDLRNDITPLFEWVSPANKIVLSYEKSDLVYLGSRRNFTGEYYFDDTTPFTKVAQYGAVSGNLEEYIGRQRRAENREGDIIRFVDGHMLKVKNDWYVRIHKMMDKIRFDRHIIDLILHEEIDDVISMLPEKESARVNTLVEAFSTQLHAAVMKYERYWNTVVASGLDRKGYAQEWMPSIVKNDSFAATYVFGRFQGRDGRTMIMDRIEKGIQSNVKWDECADWLGIPRQNLESGFYS